MEKASTVKVHKASAREIARAFFVFFATAVVIVCASVLKFVLVEDVKTRFTVVSYILFAVVIIVILSGHFVYVASSRTVVLKNIRLYTRQSVLR